MHENCPKNTYILVIVGVALGTIKNQGNEMRFTGAYWWNQQNICGLNWVGVSDIGLAILLSWKSLEANKTGKQ